MKAGSRKKKGKKVRLPSNVHCPLKWTIALLLLLLAAASYGSGQGAWSFAVIGDSRNNEKVFCKLTGMIRDDPVRPELLLHTGDMVGACDQTKQWDGYHKCLALLGPDFPVYPAIGNHEMKGGPGCPLVYSRETRLPEGKLYYSFRHKNALFISLNTEEPGHVNIIGESQMEWLGAELGKIPLDADAVFVFLHRPLFPIGVYRDQPLRNQLKLHALFRSHHVTAAFVGHEHMYGHVEKEGVHYFHAAGGGAPLYRGYGGEFYYYLRVTVEKDRVRVRAVDITGKVRDDINIRSGENK